MHRIVAMFIVMFSIVFLIPIANAHHSYAMYDGSVYRVFTGVIVRVIPNAATERWLRDDSRGPGWIRAANRVARPLVAFQQRAHRKCELRVTRIMR